MIGWIQANLGTILVTLLLIALVALIVVKLYRDKKRGGSVCGSCGGGCAACAMRGACHKQEQK